MVSKNYFIYKYTFPNGKIYIGQTHKGSRRFGKISDYVGTLVYRAMKKYPNFKKEILEYCSEEDADEKETFYINKYDSINRDKGYNRDTGGNKNKHVAPDLRKVLSEEHLGKNGIAVNQYDVEGRFIKKWPTSGLAAKTLGIHNGIYYGCKNPGSTISGFQWRYADGPQDVKDLTISQYDLQGHLVRKWRTIKEAAKSVGVIPYRISCVCSGLQAKTANFQWKYSSDPRPIGPYKKHFSEKEIYAIQHRPKKTNCRHVLQYDRNGVFLKEWPSSADVLRETGVSNLSKAIKTENCLVGGYQWKYKDSPKVIGVYKPKKWIPSAETRAKISASHKGKKSWNKGKHYYLGTKTSLSKAVLQFNLDGTFVKEWPYISLATRTLGINPSGLSECLHGRQKSAGGFIWKYKNK